MSRSAVAPAASFPRGALLGGVLLGLAGFARGAEAAPILATYEVRAAGITVMEIEARVDLDAPPGYAVEVRARMRGVASVFRSGDMTTRVQGAWSGSRPQPSRYAAQGMWAGEQRSTVLDYVGGQPAIRQLIPPNDEERESVPPEAQRNTVDTLTAVAQLLRQAQDSGRCEGRANLFDGRRLTAMQARTVGWEMLTDANWKGRSLHCRFQGQLIGGFRKDDGPDDHKPQEGNAWLAQPVEGGPFLPVRLEAPSRWFGATTITLVRARPAS
ncbi:DUF3108 domain-containing protein [Roseomonas elaeocarpi]|uniref:DUF3108 domain-containing protein n=1 Tax=Roseomonas elaeocarpi TaxID=907779 RepID=A0ABV6JQ84_9PROT